MSNGSVVGNCESNIESLPDYTVRTSFRKHVTGRGEKFL